VIVEDINLPLCDLQLPMPQNKTDNVGVLEVLRCLLQNSMVWDEEKLVQKKYEDLQFISTISQPRDDFKISNHY
jgi:hypothetical protein